MYRGTLVTLRPFAEPELERYLEWVNDAELCTLLGRATPVTMAEHRRWYEGAVGRSEHVFFSVYTNDDKRYIGNVWLWGIHPVNRTAELRVLLGDTQGQGKGYGTDACRTLVEFAFRRMNLNKVFLYVLASNPRAKRAFEKAGFREEGLLREEFYVDGAYQDVHRMGVLRSDPPPPSPPVPATE